MNEPCLKCNYSLNENGVCTKCFTPFSETCQPSTYYSQRLCLLALMAGTHVFFQNTYETWLHAQENGGFEPQLPFKSFGDEPTFKWAVDSRGFPYCAPKENKSQLTRNTWVLQHPQCMPWQTENDGWDFVPVIPSMLVNNLAIKIRSAPPPWEGR